MKPLVSILIPAFNAEEWIAQTIESALQKTDMKAEKHIAKELDVSSKDIDKAIKEAAKDVK